METSVGKLVNCDSKAELSFGLAPVDFNVDMTFDLKVEACLARSQPVVSFHGGGAKTLSTQIIFDRDAEENLDIKKVEDFLIGLSKVNSETKSIPLIEFKMGGFLFKGYTLRMGMTHSRFSTDGKTNQIKLQLSLISAEENENASK